MIAKRLFSLLSLVAIASIFTIGAPQLRAAAQSTSPQSFTGSGASGNVTFGSSGATAFDPLGATTCAITFASAGGATYTVQGAAPSVSGPFVTNTAFGTVGVITNPASNTVWAGNVAPFPHGFAIAYSGASSTIAGSVTCSGAPQLATSAPSSSPAPTSSPFPTPVPSPFNCTPTGTLTSCIAQSAGASVHIIALTITGIGTSGGSVKAVEGSGSNCAATPTTLFTITPSTTATPGSLAITQGNGGSDVLTLAIGFEFCVQTTGTFSNGAIFGQYQTY